MDKIQEVISGILVNIISEGILERFKKIDRKKSYFTILLGLICFFIGGIWAKHTYDNKLVDVEPSTSVETSYPKAAESIETIYPKEAESTETSSPDEVESIEDSIIKELKNTEIGDTFKFGRYKAIGDDDENISEIEWIVLNRENDEILAISSEGLDISWYHKESIKTTWENSDIRSWLNNYFYDVAFNDFEKAHIKLSKVEAEVVWDGAPEKDTEDYVFLFSYDNVQTYITGNMYLPAEARSSIMLCSPSDSVKTQYKLGIDDGYCWWWLRNTTHNNTDAYYVKDDGNINTDGYSLKQENGLIRPAMRIIVE